MPPPRTLAKINHKNELTISANKFHQTARGFQAINGKSYISFPENSRSHNMMLFVAELRMLNLTNNEIIPYINCAITDYTVKREKMIGKLNIKKWKIIYCPINSNILVKLRDIKKTFTKAVNKFIYKEDKKDEFTIDALIRFELLDNLEAMNIEGSVISAWGLYHLYDRHVNKNFSLNKFL